MPWAQSAGKQSSGTISLEPRGQPCGRAPKIRLCRERVQGEAWKILLYISPSIRVVKLISSTTSSQPLRGGTESLARVPGCCEDGKHFLCRAAGGGSGWACCSRREKALKISENKGTVPPPLRIQAPVSWDKGLRRGCHRVSVGRRCFHDSRFSGHCFPCTRHRPTNFLPATPRERCRCCLQKGKQRHKEDTPAQGDTVGEVGFDPHLTIPPGQVLKPGLLPELLL